METKTGKNILLSLLNQASAVIFPLLSAPIVSRALGPSGVGTQAAVNANASYFAMIATLGLQNYGSRSIAKLSDNREEERIFCQIWYMQLLCGLLAMALYGVFIGLVNTEFRMYYLANAFTVLAAVLDVSWFFFGKSMFKVITLRSVLIRNASFAAVLLLVKQPEDTIWYVMIVGLSSLIRAVSVWPIVLKRLRLIRIPFSEILRHFKPNLVLFIPVLAMSVYRMMDKTMLSAMAGVQETGYYENADKIISIALVLFTAIGSVMMPRTVEHLSQGKKQEVLSSLRASMQIQMGIAVCVCVGILAISDFAVPLYLGETFSGTIIILQILAWVPALNAWKSVLRTQFLIPASKDKTYALSLFCGAGVNVILNSILIPHFGAVGAAIGTLGAELTGLLMQTLPVRKEIPVWIMAKDLLLLIVPGIMEYFFLFAVKKTVSGIAGLVILIIGGGLVYLVTLLGCLYLLRREHLPDPAMLRERFRKQKP